LVWEGVGELANESAFADAVTALQNVEVFEVVHINYLFEKSDEAVCCIATQKQIFV
jgi:flavin-binding protein dodecin